MRHLELQQRSIEPRTPGGWTVIELAIVLCVLGLLATIAVPTYSSYRERVRVNQAIADIRLLEGAIEQYRLEFLSVPVRIDTLVDPLPVDPWGRPYQYLQIQGAPKSVRGAQRKDKNLNPLNTDYDLFSLGADGQTAGPLTAPASQDDVVRARDGAFVGLARNH